MWQMGRLGPMLGQHGHFALYAKDKIAALSRTCGAGTAH
jgi:hypothetical protein